MAGTCATSVIRRSTPGPRIQFSSLSSTLLYSASTDEEAIPAISLSARKSTSLSGISTVLLSPPSSSSEEPQALNASTDAKAETAGFLNRETIFFLMTFSTQSALKCERSLLKHPPAELSEEISYQRT